MESKKKRIKEGLLDALLEILFSLIFFGIGALALSLFGVDIDSVLNADGELLILVGIAVVFIPLIIILCLVHFVRKRRKNERENNTVSDNRDQQVHDELRPGNEEEQRNNH